jgi:hypothetical protein
VCALNFPKVLELSGSLATCAVVVGRVYRDQLIKSKLTPLVFSKTTIETCSLLPVYSEDKGSSQRAH